MIRVAVAALTLLSSTAALAQAPAPGSAADASIVVVGQATQEAVRSFVEEMSAAPRGADQLARWDRRICTGIAGVRPDYAQFLNDRIAHRALGVGLGVGQPGCRPNVLIVVATDPDAVARDLFRHHRRALGYYADDEGVTRGRAALRETFVNSDAPVRWWHVSRTTPATGQDLAQPSGGVCRMGGGDVLDIMRCYPTNNAGGGTSRLRANNRQDFGAAFVIVDANRLPEIGSDFNALADYLAMVSLAQLDPQADIESFPTVLNLWSGDAAAPHEMTAWDLAYLRALYTATGEAVSQHRQEGDIARQMRQESDQAN
jgi:hypothetical protein